MPVDREVPPDVLPADPEWSDWSADALARCADDSTLAISPITYVEVSIRFARIEDLEATLPEADVGKAWDRRGTAGGCNRRQRDVPKWTQKPEVTPAHSSKIGRISVA